MESEKLLPCPFCGAEDKYLVQALTQATETFVFWSVECSFCGVEVADDESQEKANAAWNTRAPADCKLADNDGKNCALLKDHEGSCLSYDPKEVGVRLMSALGHVENCRAHGRVTDAGFAAIRSALLIADRELSRLRAPADLRSALEAETIERAARAMAEEAKAGPWDRMHETAPRGWGETAGKTYWRNMATIAAAALAPTKGDVS